ncbi:structure-specific endonuclease subunit EME2 isoform X6 [Urocitellus parryii]
MAAAGPDRAGRSIWAGPALKGARRTPSHPLHPLGTQRCPERPAPQFRGGPAPPSHTHTRPNAQRPKPRIQTVLEDTGADVLMEALGALGCECRIEPQRRARSLRWSGVRHDPGSVAPEVWATEEQELLLLLLLEPEEFLQGTAQLTQTEGPPCPVPWISPESPAHPHLAVIGLDAHLWSCQPSAQGMQQLQNSEVVQAKEVVSWPEVEEVAGLQASRWPEMALGCVGFGGDRSGSLTGSALLWQMPLSPPSPPHAFCSRRSWPAAQNRNVWASWLTSLWRPAKADSPEGWGLTSPAASACS